MRRVHDLVHRCADEFTSYLEDSQMVDPVVDSFANVRVLESRFEMKTLLMACHGRCGAHSAAREVMRSELTARAISTYARTLYMFAMSHQAGFEIKWFVVRLRCGMTLVVGRRNGPLYEPFDMHMKIHLLHDKNEFDLIEISRLAAGLVLCGITPCDYIPDCGMYYYTVKYQTGALSSVCDQLDFVRSVVGDFVSYVDPRPGAEDVAWSAIWTVLTQLEKQQFMMDDLLKALKNIVL